MEEPVRMTVMRVERVVYGVPNLEECIQFFDDFGLERLVGDGPGARFGTLLGQVVEVKPADDASLPPAVEDGATLREIVWGVDTAEALEQLADGLAADREAWRADGEVHTIDETGFGVGLAVSHPADSQTTQASTERPGANRTGAVTRWNQPLDPPARVRPLRLCHVALNIPKAGREQAAAFYTDRLGFHPTDRVRDMGVFMRCPGDHDQHTMLLCHRPDRAGVNHTAYEVATVDEVIVGANDMIDRGWREARRLGRHTVGSNIFRFIHAPCGGRVEFAADMDRVDDSYGPNDHEVTPPHHLWTLKTSREEAGT
jgi:catechol 2,3-dioxygenase-like lactoylglutathione lyase family enzyme